MRKNAARSPSSGAEPRGGGNTTGPPDRAAAGIARHFDGWQPALLAIFLAGTTASLIVPRPVEPEELPAPSVDPRATRRIVAADEERALAAEQSRLDLDVRALGKAFRDYGRADADGDEAALMAARTEVLGAAARALGRGEEELLRLRAYELRSFLREVRRWESTGEETNELRELGGGFARMAERNGWLEPGSPRRLLLDGTALRASFKKRWNEITGLRGAAFDPPLDELRAFYGFLLEHPIVPGGQGEAARPMPEGERRAFEDRFRLKKIDELSAIDPAYPKELARGIVLYRLGRYPLAVEAFRRHLERSPDGPFALRAQNYLRAALGKANDESF